MRIKALIIPLVVMAAAMAAEPYHGARIFWDMTTEKTVFESGFYGRMIELQDGRLMAVCEHSGIQVAYSTNKGSSWSDPSCIATNPSGINECVPDLIQLSDGTIIVGYNPRPNSPYSEERKFGIRCRRSTDNGASWSQEIYIYDAWHTFDDGCWEPSFLELPSGELQCYFADESPYITSNEQQISVSRSFDQGLTWSDPERVCFRPENRDGMPAAILLRDPDEIVVIVEDNGWYRNQGNFTPTTVRCPLDVNWHDYYVSADDENRDMIFSTLPGANMAAPYLRQLPSGVTVASCQGLLGRSNGNLDMFVAVGNDRARDFKALSRPFALSDNEQSLWNSLSIIEDSVVVAVGGVEGKIKMIKGYAVETVVASYSENVSVDGEQGSGETYTHAKRNQLPMGHMTRNRMSADFAYDDENLYFTSRVIDDDIVNTNYNDNDKVSLYLDAANVCSESPTEGMHRYDFDSKGTMWYRAPQNGVWILDKDYDEVTYAINTAGRSYTIEAAIPWTSLGYEAAPVGQTMRVALQMTDKHADGKDFEEIPDVDYSKSCTWIEFKLLDNKENALPDIFADKSQQAPTVKCQWIGHDTVMLESPLTITGLKRYSAMGYLLGQSCPDYCSTELQIPERGLQIIEVEFANGSRTALKIAH